MVRIAGEGDGVPVLYDMKQFEVTSSRLPDNWTVVQSRPGCLDFRPAAWAGPGFWNAHFDQKPEAVASFEEERRKIIASDP
jgi:hypothetical protein